MKRSIRALLLIISCVASSSAFAENPMKTVFAYSHAWRSLNNIHADHVITSMPITQ